MHDAPPWIVLDPARGPTCVRCGAAWDRTEAADADAALADREDYIRADAVLQGLVAFVDYHQWCGGGEEAVRNVLDRAAAVGAVEVRPEAAGDPDEGPPSYRTAPLPVDPILSCPRCGEVYKHQSFKRCYSVACNPPPEGGCPKCGKPYKKRRYCFHCNPTPVMLRHRGNGKVR